jgi:hypothetical protein
MLPYDENCKQYQVAVKNKQKRREEECDLYGHTYKCTHCNASS